jgi:hypothetical protein
MFSSRFEAEGLIESGDFVNMGQRKIKAFGNLNQCLSRKVVHSCLNILKDTDQGSLLIAVPFNDLANGLQVDWHQFLFPVSSLVLDGEELTRMNSLESIHKLRF